ncbi:MAG: FAD-binding oxidoreductase [Bacteroidales bacterium]|nr:FAD-binding oxidoreductase [Bacteroidales bacterium]
MKELLKQIKERVKGKLILDETRLILYSTDASAYREKPLAVFIPEEDYYQDIKLLLDFCKTYNTFLIPRAAGTSLAGQVVGNGIVVDVSKNLNKILEVNQEEKWVRVQAGVVLQQLNNYLKPYNLFFGPETSTANRCCIGGMVGNNSCGLHSLVYGSTRDHLLEAKVILSDGKQIELKQYNQEEFQAKAKQEDLEGKIYNYIQNTYSSPQLKQEIEENFPEKQVTRRNNGYALDTLIDTPNPNLAKLFAGSEGTLAFATEFKLNLIPLPPKHKSVLCVHFSKLYDSFLGNLIALQHSPMAVELMDNNIIEAAYRNPTQKQNTFFIEGNPKAILIVEFAEESSEKLEEKLRATIEHFKKESSAYAFPVIYGGDISKVWELRKAGLGLLTNVAGDYKPVSVIEDTAVSPERLPLYLSEFASMLSKHNLQCVYHAHIATGELHLRPILNLKDKKDVELFHTISKEVALLVKKHRGSLSGEHGDGRLRGEWIPLMYGERIYELMRSMKNVWDADNVFNKGKIIDTPKMNTSLRYENINPPQINTYYSFESQKGFLCAIEQCNGSADCRKSLESGGKMCPTFQVSHNEWDTPRARANILREKLSFSNQENPFASKEIKSILDNCLMCKACKSECPSNVDIAKLKSEFLQHYYDATHAPFNILMINSLPKIQKCFSSIPFVYNWTVRNAFTSSIIKSLMGFAQERSLPAIKPINFEKQLKKLNPSKEIKKLYLFIDEFSALQDSQVAEIAIKLFTNLGYKVEIAPIKESGRIAISKGLVKKAKKIAQNNINKLRDIINENSPMIGIEPSTLLSFRDEYPSLVNEDISELNKHIYLFDEFIAKEIDNNNIIKEQFTDTEEKILLHGHCQQKALIGGEYMIKMLSLPENYSVDFIPSGCCGMAGSYGYEKKNYQMSKQIADLVLTKAINQAKETTIISAPGTSCREQIKHFTNRIALHPIEIMYNALKTK